MTEIIQPKSVEEMEEFIKFCNKTRFYLTDLLKLGQEYYNIEYNRYFTYWLKNKDNL